MTIRRAIARFLALTQKKRLERELEQDIRAHLELAERDGLARGLSPEEARLSARRSFGGVEQVKEEHRDRRGIRWIEVLLSDLRHGLALLTRSPGFTAAVVSVLAVGIGATVAMFSIFDEILLKPLPFSEPDRIVSVWEAPRPGAMNATSGPDFVDWRRLGSAFEALSAEHPISMARTGDGDPARLSGKEVTADYFRVFGVGARLGRTFRTEDERPENVRVIVLSYATWQNDFGDDPDILRRRPILDGESHQIVGVLQPGAFDRDRTQFWKPLAVATDQQRDMHWLTVYGRLRGDASLAEAREQMRAIHAALLDTKAVNNREGTIVVEPLARVLTGPGLRHSVSVVFGAVAMVLLIACANVVNLLLAKGATRRRELAVRAALGAGRGRLIAQLLTESFLLCFLGGAAGVVLGDVLIREAKPMLATTLPFTADLSLDFRVLAFGAMVSVGVGLLAASIPAFQTSLGNLDESMSRSTRGSSDGFARIRRGIVVGEVALSLVLLCGALLLFRSLVKLQQLDTGVLIERVTAMSIDLPVAAYSTPQRAALFYQALAERVRAAPGVVHAGITTHLPLRWIGNGEGIDVSGSEKLVRVRFKRVDPGYFTTLGIPILAGRGVTSQDREGTQRIIVINQALATRLADAAGLRDPIGKTVRLTSSGYLNQGMFMAEVMIAGVIRNERVASPGMPDPPVAYAPLAQVPDPGINLIVRSRYDADAVVPAIRQALHDVDPNLPLGEVATMEQVRDDTLSGTSRPAWIIGAFAGVAIILAGIGLYGVISHAVSLRRREIGIRMALGARPRDVVAEVLRNAAALVGVGLVLGLSGALVLTRLMTGLLFDVSPLDPTAFLLACVSMALIGLFAGYFPASGAARVDPVETLRDEG